MHKPTFRRFKIFDCPHCQDKFCTQEDLERHLAKVEKNNMVKGETKQLQPLRPKPVTDKNIENTESTEKGIEAEKEKGNDKTPAADVENRENNDKNTSEVVKELEAKTFSCSECGFKTHSRMAYIQHVLNGCVMDMVLGEVRSKINISSGLNLNNFLIREVNQPLLDLTASLLKEVRGGGRKEVRIKTRGLKLKFRIDR